MDQTIIITQITIANLSTLIRWRNQNRRYFINQERVTPIEHRRWYTAYETDREELLYMIKLNNQDVGTIGIKVHDPQAHLIERVLIPDPNHRRRGIMTEAMRQIMKKHPAPKYQVKVLKENQPAINFYQKHGFETVKEYDTYILMQKNVQS